MNSITPWIKYNGPYKPKYQTRGSAGCDLESTIDVVLRAGSRLCVPTGIFLEIPPGFVGLVCPRSGLALKCGVTVLNAPGVIDQDFRGEVQVILINLSAEDYSIKKGDRIAQLLFSPNFQGHFRESDELQASDRDTGGFGSTGR